MTLYTYYLCHALLVSRITCVTHYCFNVSLPANTAVSPRSLPFAGAPPPPGANQSRLRKQRDSKSPTRFSPRWVVSYIGYIGMCRAKGYAFFSCFGRSEIGHQCRPFWSEIGYGLCTLSLELGMFLRRISNFFIIWQ